MVRSQGLAMPIRVDAYITGGMASGVLARTGHLRDVLDSSPTLDLERTTWQALDGDPPRPAGAMSIPVDDLLVAVADDDPVIPVHATWHQIVLEIGPFRIHGELPTLPGFDPDRALTRPSGEFVLLRDVRIARVEDPGPPALIGRQAVVNRYNVERVRADIALGFFFPGAIAEDPEPASA
jgi:hypothetical protein